MDEISFGSDREIRPPSWGRRALVAALSVASAAAVAAGVQHAVSAERSAVQPAAAPATPVRLPSKGCPPSDPGWPTMAGLPVGLRPGALTVIVGAQFSGRCTAP